MSDSRIVTGSPKAKTPRLDIQDAVTARPTDITGNRVEPHKHTGPDSRRTAAMSTDGVNAQAQLPDASVGVGQLVGRALNLFSFLAQSVFRFLTG